MWEDLTDFNIHAYEYYEPEVEDYVNSDPNHQDEFGRTLLHKYILNTKFDPEVFQKIINNSANLDLRNKSGKTPLVYAVLIREKKGVEILIKNGANVNAEDNMGNNALHYIALPEINCKYELNNLFNFDDTYCILDRLLMKGVNVNAKNKISEETPLMWAARGRHLQIVQKLLAFGANVFATDSDGFTCLHFAAEYYHNDALSVSKKNEKYAAIVAELVQNKACINCFNCESSSPLFHVQFNDHLAKELIRNAALLHWYKKIVFYLNEDFFLRNYGCLAHLSKYADLCYEEIDEMKKHILPGKPDEEKNAMERKILPHGSNLCEFARVGVSEDELRETPEIKDEVFKILLKESFPLYLDLLSAKLGRQFLLQRGKFLSIFTKGQTEVVYLHTYIVDMICLFLENADILNLLSAFSDQFC